MSKKRLCIIGIPTSGKTYLGKRLATEVGGICVSLDAMREDLARSEIYAKWVNFYFNVDEYRYLTTTTGEERWSDLVNQSEGLWSGILQRISKYSNETRPVIFEGVNLLPHLVSRDLHMPCITIIGRTFEEVLERNKTNPRWGNTGELQTMEAKSFYYDERPRYKSESEKFGCPVFETADEAWNVALDMLLSREEN